MHGFVQLPCPKCSTTTWITPQVGYGICPACHTEVRAGGAPAGAGVPMPGPVNAPAGPAAPPMAMPMAMASRPGGHRLRAALMIGAVVVIGAGSVAFMTLKNKYLGTGKKDTASYVSLGLNADRPDGDAMITSVADRATKWKKDAYFWSVNYQAVRSDGTVDVEKGAEVQYISPSRVVKKSKKDREDSIRKFAYSQNGADYSKQWDAINEWKNVEKPEAPECTIKDLTGKLQKDGLTGDKTVRISFDPQFDWKSEQLWHVIGTDPQIDARYSMKTCEKVE
ncbi:MAG: hypothetical protein HOW73_33840 [Polyangiaceae bacterium]|nr:hypothetical protein [Polyangiaceae bacterium]